MLKHFAIISILCTLLACEQSSRKESLDSSTPSAFKMIPASPASQNGSDTSGSSSPVEAEQKKIIRNGDLRFQVTDIDSATDKIEGLTKRFNGYISSSNLTSSYDQVEN